MDARQQPDELETLAAAVHGALFFGHAIGLLFHLRRRNRLDAVIHAAAALYDGTAAIRHWKARRIQNPLPIGHRQYGGESVFLNLI